jgi:hypothetical protein
MHMRWERGWDPNEKSRETGLLRPVGPYRKEKTPGCKRMIEQLCTSCLGDCHKDVDVIHEKRRWAYSGRNWKLRKQKV